MNKLRRAGAYVLLTCVYTFTLLGAVLGHAIPRRRWTPNGRIAVTGTFFNPNWYLSHITPLALSGVNEVILVIDEPQIPLKGVRFVCPPRWLAKVISRAGAKALWMLVAGIRYRPDLYMGYHIVPGACSALLAGALLGRPTCYQMTVGPLEVIGGGIGTESIAGTLGRPSRLIEALALAILRRFDLIVVRGNKARQGVEAYGIRGTLAVITGSIQVSPSPAKDRGIDLVFVGRLAPVKQVDQFLEIVKALCPALPSIRAAVVGDGPLLDDLRAQSARWGLSNRVEFLGKRKDVASILADSKVFVLTSQYEGLSIAMAEAMAAGAVPVVADVGELGDLVVDGVNGYLIEPNCIGQYADRIRRLVEDRETWAALSDQAKRTAVDSCEIGAVSARWGRYLKAVVARASERGLLPTRRSLLTAKSRKTRPSE